MTAPRERSVGELLRELDASIGMPRPESALLKVAAVLDAADALRAAYGHYPVTMAEREQFATVEAAYDAALRELRKALEGEQP